MDEINGMQPTDNSLFTNNDNKLNRQILAIDDDVEILNTYQGMLEAKPRRQSLLHSLADIPDNEPEISFDLTVAHNGLDGIQQVKRSLEINKPFAMALVDMRMPPGPDGLETAIALRKLDSRIYIILVTAYTDHSTDTIQKRIHKNVLIMKKPVSKDEIRQLAFNLCHAWVRDRDLHDFRCQLEQKVEQRTNALKETARKLKTREVQLLQSDKMASLGQLSAGVAHEINNPIGFIISNLNTLDDYITQFKALFKLYEQLALKCADGKVDGEGQEIIDKIAEFKEVNDLDFALQDVSLLVKGSIGGGERIKEIVQNLKTFARVDKADLDEVDVNDCIRNTLTVIANELKYTCEVRQNLHKLPKIYCHAGQLNQVFTNLLLNSAQAITNNGIITIESMHDEESVIVQISDTGHGIDEKDLPYIFDPFFTTKAVGEGTGLGLSISHGIIHDHHGSIVVQSQKGQGTTFTIRLPISVNLERPLITNNKSSGIPV
ncbi:MAG: hybrid sensor histidine kinase/response regulator [Magnetococcales bacterium]|nr:hybrid sensor histidine kinase/response regulator [Magnetococcales bacterium]